jgi:hypothetical protein
LFPLLVLAARSSTFLHPTQCLEMPSRPESFPISRYNILEVMLDEEAWRCGSRNHRNGRCRDGRECQTPLNLISPPIQKTRTFSHSYFPRLSGSSPHSTQITASEIFVVGNLKFDCLSMRIYPTPETMPPTNPNHQTLVNGVVIQRNSRLGRILLLRLK